mgnify:FL=1
MRDHTTLESKAVTIAFTDGSTVAVTVKQQLCGGAYVSYVQNYPASAKLKTGDVVELSHAVYTNSTARALCVNISGKVNIVSLEGGNHWCPPETASWADAVAYIEKSGWAITVIGQFTQQGVLELKGGM